MKIHHLLSQLLCKFMNFYGLGAGIEAWLAKSKDCPNCREEFKSTKISRVVLDLFSETDLICTKCSITFKPVAVQAHRDSCLLSNKCTLGCESQQIFKGYEEIRTHLISSCPKVNMVCHDCNTKMIRSETEAHACLSVY